MSACEILNAFPYFLTVWDEIQHSSLEVQRKTWLDKYMSSHPELLQKQRDDHASLNQDRRATASEHIFSVLLEGLEFV